MLHIFQIVDDLKMAIAAVPLVASVKVCSLILFLAVASSLACNPMDIYSPPQTKTATTTTERPMTWSTMMDSEEVSQDPSDLSIAREIHATPIQSKRFDGFERIDCSPLVIFITPLDRT